MWEWLIPPLVLSAVMLFGFYRIGTLFQGGIGLLHKDLTSFEESEPNSTSTDELLAKEMQELLTLSDPEEIDERWEAIKAKRRILKSMAGDYVEQAKARFAAGGVKGGKPSSSTEANKPENELLSLYGQIKGLWEGLSPSIKTVVNNLAKSKLGKSVEDILATADTFKSGVDLIKPAIEQFSVVQTSTDHFDPNMSYKPGLFG